MVISYKHIRIKYQETNINIWTNHTQYYRTLLRAHSVCMPSVIEYSLIYNSNSNRIGFKSRQMANIIGKFIYYYIRFIKIYSYFYKFFKNIIKTRYLKKTYYHRYYKSNKLLFKLNLKHFILLIRKKILIKLKKNRHRLWQLFYNIPNNFWSNSIKKRLKYLIWNIFFLRNQPNYKTPKKYIGKNTKTKGSLYFLNYNKISSLVYYTINRKRIPKKEWLEKKNNEKKKRRKRKFGIYFYSNIYADVYKNINSTEVYKEIFTNLQFSSSFNNIYTIEVYKIFLNMYCHLLQYIKLSNINSINYLNLYYLYISNIYKRRISNNLITTHTDNTKNTILKSNSHNTFNFNIWYNIFIKQHNIYTYFNINSIIIYKNRLCIYSNILLLILNTNNNSNIFFIRYNIDNFYNNNTYNNKQISNTNTNNILTNINNFSNYKNYYRKTNLKILSFKRFSIKNRMILYTTKSIFYKKIIKKIKELKKNKKIYILKNVNINNNHIINLYKYYYKNNYFFIRKITNRRRLFRTFYYIFKNTVNNLVRSNKRKNIVIHKNQLNNLFINNYYMNLFKLCNQYKNTIQNNNKKIKDKYINKHYTINIYKYLKIKKIILNNRFINSNYYCNNNILHYKKIIKKLKNIKLYNKLNNTNINNIVLVKVGLNIKIINKNNLLYYFYFNNSTIYKEIITEYNIRIHNKDNKYDQLFILHKKIIIFINKKINIGNIKNGIYLYLNCFYYNNSINYISLLYKINKYSNIPIIPVFTYSKKYFVSINNIL